MYTHRHTCIHFIAYMIWLCHFHVYVVIYIYIYVKLYIYRSSSISVYISSSSTSHMVMTSQVFPRATVLRTSCGCFDWEDRVERNEFRLPERGAAAAGCWESWWWARQGSSAAGFAPRFDDRLHGWNGTAGSTIQVGPGKAEKPSQSKKHQLSITHVLTHNFTIN